MRLVGEWRLRQIYLVEHLIIIPARGGLLIGREGNDVCAFKVNERGVVAEKFCMEYGIVETVILMRRHLASIHPRTRGSLGFREPDFTEKGTRSRFLGKNREPLFAPRMPCNMSSVDGNSRALRRCRLFLGSEFFPGRGIFPIFVGSRAAQNGEGVTEEDPGLAVEVGPTYGMTFRDGWCVRGGGALLPKGGNGGELSFRFIPLG